MWSWLEENHPVIYKTLEWVMLLSAIVLLVMNIAEA